MSWTYTTKMTTKGCTRKAAPGVDPAMIERIVGQAVANAQSARKATPAKKGDVPVVHPADVARSLGSANAVSVAARMHERAEAVDPAAVQAEAQRLARERGGINQPVEIRDVIAARRAVRQGRA